MTEEATKEGEGTETTAETTTTEETAEEAKYTQADMDRLLAKVKKPLETKLTAATTKLEEARVAALSADESKIEAARAEGATAAEAKLLTVERKADIKLELIGEGAPKDQAESIYRMVDTEAEPKAAVADLKKRFPGLFATPGTMTAAPGGRNAEGKDEDGIPTDPMELDAWLQESAANKALYAKNREKVKARQAQKFGGGFQPL